MASDRRRVRRHSDERDAHDRYSVQYKGQSGGYGQVHGGLNYEGIEPARRDHQSHARIDEGDTGGYRGGRLYLTGYYDGGRFDYGIDYGDNLWARDFELDNAARERHAVQPIDYGGVGPRGYSRSDERIFEDVSDRMMEDPQLDATDIEVLVAGGEVTLNGSVDSRADRRRAEAIAYGVRGVNDVLNNLRLQRSGYGT